jgi:hypothetical protein
VADFVSLIERLAAESANFLHSGVDIVDLKADMIDAQLHGFAVDHPAHVEYGDIEVAVGQIDSALADADLFETEGFFVKGRGFFDIVSSDRDMLDLRHDFILRIRLPRAGRRPQRVRVLRCCG